MLNGDNVKELARLIDKEFHLSEAIKASEQELKEKNKVLIETRDLHKKQIADLKEKLSIEAVEEFKETGNKKLLGGIGIRETETVSYDLKQAFEWAKEKDMFLQLDDKAFKKAVKSLGLDFVKTDKVTSVTFPAKLEV